MLYHLNFSRPQPLGSCSTESAPLGALQKAVADALTFGGKRVRAVLALLWCEAFCGEWKAALPISVAYELAHASALIQDDIIDHSDLRRGKKSIVAKYGPSNAVLASDLLLFQVPKLVSQYRNLNSERLCRLFDLVGESCRSTTWGEFLDLELATRSHVGRRGKKSSNIAIPDEKEYDEMIRLKTASLLGAPCASGAIVGNASDAQVKTAYEFGECLGMAYQVQDDLLDLMGDVESLGKPVFTDVRGGKWNIVLIHSLERCTKEELGFIQKLLGRADYGDAPRPSSRHGPQTLHFNKSEIDRARRIFVRYGSIEYARAKAARYVEDAQRALESLTSFAEFRPSSAAKRLLGLCDYLSKRYY